MKILKIIGIAAGIHALVLLLIFANPGCSASNAADQAPITSAPTSAPAPDASMAPGPVTAAPQSDAPVIRYSPTRPGTPIASALSSQPVQDVVPATTYTVAHGDTLSSIAKRNGLTKADLAAANKLRSSSVLHVGQKIVIPSRPAPGAASASVPTSAETPAAEAQAAESPAAEKAPAGEATHHVVAPGETLGAIARRFGVKTGDIAVANNITDPKKIQPGQDLVIPARASSGQRGTKASKPAQPAAEQDLDAGLKTQGGTDVPMIKVDSGAGASQQPKSP